MTASTVAAMASAVVHARNEAAFEAWTVDTSVKGAAERRR